MKPLLLLLLLCTTVLMAIPSAESIFYADSYMLRAHGVQANYWNPARLQKIQHTELWLPALNAAVVVSNNAIDLDTYNYFVARDTLFAVDKERLLRHVKGEVSGSTEGSISILGFTIGNTALSSSTRFFVKASAKEDILRLALYGNTEDSYSFERSTNNISGMGYTDITYGAGDFAIPFLPERIPPIKVGFAISALAGLANLSTQHFSAGFSTDLESGTNAHMEMVLRSSTFGLGSKVLLGMYSEILPAWEMGITLDNIGGNIRWLGSNQERTYRFAVDSLYAASVDEDFYTQSDEAKDIDAYSTALPMELRLAAKYSLSFMDLSADWVQGFRDSAISSATGRLSCASSVYLLPILPLSVGIAFPNSSTPLKISYSIGIRSKLQELSIAVQSYDSILPGYKSKGVSLATSMRFWF